MLKVHDIAYSSSAILKEIIFRKPIPLEFFENMYEGSLDCPNKNATLLFLSYSGHSFNFHNSMTFHAIMK